MSRVAQPDSAAQSPLYGCGVCLDPAWAQVAGYFGPPPQGQARRLDGGARCIPPAVLVPRLPGEPLRADTHWPPHPRGSGEPWPPEAQVHPDQEGGRFPLAYAWPMLKKTERPSWCWQNVPVPPPKAIACVWAGVTRRWLAPQGRSDPAPLTCLVIPNHLPEPSQQALVDAARSEGLQAKLLWRPVAAAMAWCQHHESLLARLPWTADRSVGTLLVLHLGLDEWEGALLDVVPQVRQERVYFLPARARPQTSHSPNSYGLDFLHQLARQALPASSANEFAKLWQLLWCTPWMQSALVALEGRDGLPLLKDTPHTDYARVQPFQQEWQRLSQHVTARVSRRSGRANGHLPSLVADDVMQWRGTLERIAFDRPLIGAVVTGPMAALCLEGQSLGRRQVRHVWPKAQRILCEGIDLPAGILALSAAGYAAARAAQLPTYLDTLPRLRVAVSREGVPAWVDLLDEKQGFVDGGQVWRRPENVKGLELAARETQMTIALHHEDYRTVRQVRSKLPKAPDHNMAISLDVSIEPAQGNARVEVVPDDAQTFGHHRIYVDWDTMQDTHKPPDIWLGTLPRCFPDVKPFLPAHPTRWQRTRKNSQPLRRQLELMLSHQGQSSQLQRALVVLYVDSNLGVSGDGTVPSEQKDLDDLVDGLVRYLEKPKLYGGRLDERYVVTILGRTYTSHVGFQKYLAKRIRLGGDDVRPYELLAIGRCVRAPLIVQQYVQAVLHRLKASHERPSNWLKALSLILMHRQDATRELSPDLGHVLSGHLIAIFEGQLALKNCNLIFKHSANAIVYLLRIRALHDAYMDPGSGLAQRIKQSFQRAKRLAEGGKIRLMGGKKLEDELQLLIDYIDRKGIGLPGLVDEEEEDEADDSGAAGAD